MRGKIALILVISLLAASIAAAAQDSTVKFTSNQSEYYFPLGQDAKIGFGVENANPPISGQITYTITQQVQQQGMSYSSTKTQSAPATVSDTGFGINLGTSNSPASFILNMEFDYKDNDSKDVYVTLPEIRVNFVQNSSQQQGAQSQQQSTSKTQEQVQQEQEEQQQKQQEEAKRQMQNEQMMQNAQNRVQNNQVNQDSQALKQQMQEEQKKQQELEDKFQQNLAKNPEFQNKARELMKSGYNATGGSVDPSSEDSGKFEYDFKNDNGETAKLSGEMQNSSMKSIMSQTSEDQKSMMQQLKGDPQFQKYSSQLAQAGFNQTTPGFDQKSQNQTKISVPYKDELGEEKKITADYVNGKIQNITADKPYEKTKKSYIWYILLACLVCAAIFFIYKRYLSRKKAGPETEPIPTEKQVDYLGESDKMLKIAQELFHEKKEKDAYEMVSRAVRFYCSHKHGSGKEMVGSEVIKLLKRKKSGPIEEVKDCLALCGMVEFAKYRTNKKDFDDIVAIARKVIV